MTGIIRATKPGWYERIIYATVSLHLAGNFPIKYMALHQSVAYSVCQCKLVNKLYEFFLYLL